MVEIKRFYARNSEEFRKWFEKHGEKQNRMALIIYKKHTGKPSLNHLQAMHEAICFGWIDTTTKRVDEERYIIHFAKRNKNSKWSRNTRKYARNLIKLGKMTPQGLNAFKLGLRKPAHDHGIPRNPKPSKKLISQLKEHKLIDSFNKISPSNKRIYLRWLEKAKREETKDKRIKLIINNLKSNKKFNF